MKSKVSMRAYQRMVGMVGLILISLAAGRVRAEEPKPRWTASVQAMENLHATPDTLLVVSDINGSSGLTALDRQSGRQLWQIEGQFTSKDEGSNRTIEAKSTTLVGVTTPKRQPQVAVLLYSYQLEKIEMAPSYQLKDSRQAELRGVDLHTGKEIWNASLELNLASQATELYYHLIWYPLGVYGQTIVLHRSGTQADARFLDARTGVLLNPSHPQDKAFLRESATLYGKHYAGWGLVAESGLIELDPKASNPIRLSGLQVASGGYSYLVGRAGNKMVYFVSTDDGNTGHSIWPNYLVCYSVTGEQLWQFPKHLPDRNDYDTLLKRLPLQLHSGTMDPLGRTVFAMDSSYLYALNPNSGRLLWKRSDISAMYWLPYGQGYVGLSPTRSNPQTGDLDTATLHYVDGLTGKTKQTLVLKPGHYPQLFQAGQDFLLVTQNGQQSQLSYYSGQTLFGLAAQ